MPTQFDKIFRPLAKTLINDTFGTTATLRQVTKTFNNVTSQATETNTDTTVKISPPVPVAESRVGGVVEAGDAVTKIAAQGLAVRPNPTDYKLVWDSKVWQIVQVNPRFSGDQVAVYELILRS